MRLSRMALRCWPGLTSLWEGRWSGLMLACCFAVVFNLALAANFLWTEQWAAAYRVAAVLVASGFWVVAFLRTPARRGGGGSGGDARSEGLFLRAQGEYLRGHWYEAQSLLNELLRKFPDDADARLLLAGVHRRSGDARQARQQLRQVNRLTSKWDYEVRKEEGWLPAQSTPTGSTNNAGSTNNTSLRDSSSSRDPAPAGESNPRSAAAGTERNDESRPAAA